MHKLISLVVGFFANGTGQVIGKSVEKVAMIAALTPLAIWLYSSGDEVAVIFSFTYKQLALYGAVAFFVVKILYYTRPGSAQQHGDYRE